MQWLSLFSKTPLPGNRDSLMIVGTTSGLISLALTPPPDLSVFLSLGKYKAKKVPRASSVDCLKKVQYCPFPVDEVPPAKKTK